MSDPRLDGPRSPDEHDLTGTGTPRSADDGLPQPGATGDAAATERDRAATVGATSTTDSAFSDELRVNRSGSGGSGGAATPAELEGSTPASMSELLSGEQDRLVAEDDAEPAER